jgi:malate/lactate dehydrogenase
MLVVTNPVDVMTYVALKCTGVASSRLHVPRTKGDPSNVLYLLHQLRRGPTFVAAGHL